MTAAVGFLADTNEIPIMPHFTSDLRLAFRRARKRPGFTLVAVLSLTLGIGANSAVFSLVDAILLRRAPIPQPERIVEIYQRQTDFPYAPFSYPDYVDFRRTTANTFSQISISEFTVAARDAGDHVESLMGELVNGDYFPLLGLRAQVGRLLGREDDVTPGGHPVVVLSNEYWRREFNSDPSVVGRTMRLSGHQYTIVGVAPGSYTGMLSGIAPAVFMPIMMINQVQPDARDQMTQRGNHSGFIKARLAPGASVMQARTMAETFTNTMAATHPDNWPKGTALTVIPMKDIAVNPLLDSVVVPAAAALMGVVALVLLVACANLASFLLAHARDRRKEVAIRLAIGANRGALIRQFLIEALLLATVGGISGVILAGVALRAILHADLPLPLPITVDVSLDWRVLGFSILASAIAGVMFGLLPALQATRATVVETIKNENADGGPVRHASARNLLVIGQVAVSLTLAHHGRAVPAQHAGARRGRSRLRTSAGRHGLVGDSRGPLRLDATTAPARAPRSASARRIPGVDRRRSDGQHPPQPAQPAEQAHSCPGVTPPNGRTDFDVDFAAADTGYLGSIGVSIVRGRGFTAADTRGAPHVAIINEAMAQKFWPGKESIGQTFSTDSATYRVVGVTHTTKIRTLGEEPRPFIIAPLAQEFSVMVMLVARTNGDAERTATQMLSTLREVDPGIMAIQVKTMEKHLAAMLLPGATRRDGVHALRRTRARAGGPRRLRRGELRGRTTHA